jgi:GDSL-like Lipase/Acylhydrolase.
MFESYIALGDSMSIDLYPARDAEEKGISKKEKLGASSLLHKNDDELFPEFKGQDLASWFSGIQYHNLAVDGATCEDLLSPVRVKDLKEVGSKKALVTLTLGGNDLLQAFRKNGSSDRNALASEFRLIPERYGTVIETIMTNVPDCVLILTTVFDPTDGTGIMPSATSIYSGNLPIEYLHQFNSMVVTLGGSHLLRLADVHKHFAGHGAECGGADDFWYWKHSPIEPSLRGASEIRRVWAKTVEEIRNRKN